MKYLVIYADEYEYDIKDFDTRIEADEYLFQQIDRNPNSLEDYKLLEYTQEFDVAVAVDKQKEKRDLIREQALSKLTDEEILILGLTKD